MPRPKAYRRLARAASALNQAAQALERAREMLAMDLELVPELELPTFVAASVHAAAHFAEQAAAELPEVAQ